MSAQFEDFNSIFNEFQQNQREARRNEEAAPARTETRRAEPQPQPNAEAIREREARVQAESERDALRAEIDAAKRRDMESRGDFQGLLDLERADRKREREEADHWVAETTRKAIDPEVRRLAKKLGMIDLSDTAHLNLKHVSVTTDGRVTGLDNAFADLRKAKPHFFGDGEKRERGEHGRFVARPRIVGDYDNGYQIEREGSDPDDWGRKNAEEFRKDMNRQFGLNI